MGKFTEDPGIGSSLPEGALYPLTFPETLSTKNHSFARGGGGMEGFPPLHAIARNATDVTVNAASQEIHEGLAKRRDFSCWFLGALLSS